MRSKHSLIFQIFYFVVALVGNYVLLKSFPLESMPWLWWRSGHKYILLLLSSPYQSHEASFLDPQCEKLVHFLDILESPKTVILRTPSHTSHIQQSIKIIWCFYHFRVTMPYAPSKQTPVIRALCIHLFLQIAGITTSVLWCLRNHWFSLFPPIFSFLI